ncbi:aminotransferase class IV [Candidatus Albibeggiatoa sp. nov. NOAA]|uniref:aminotransferase class IV n=1 Tax=Candidatus Albibeggiatoa sp. nov. NOAA TaxID=3162724 RepID=UPI0032F75871|nr:aminotransferase class IV [Thiotrichaceae bacterium]
MSQLLETVKCIDGKAQNLIWHQQRVNQACRLLFKSQQNIDLSSIFEQAPKSGIFRCRILYQQQIEKIEFIPYQTPKIKSFKLIEANELDYSFKYADRQAINALVAQKQQADDIIIIQNQHITDTSIANIACWDGQSWLTPEKPLLHGTTRARLLAENKIISAKIDADEIKQCTKIALLNALLGFYVIEQPYFL